MPSSGPFLRQPSSGRSTSRRWVGGIGNNKYYSSGGGCERSLKQMEVLDNIYGASGNFGEINNGGLMMRKRVMVLVDQTSHSKHAMMWALTHVANKGDLLTLLHAIPPPQHNQSSASCSPNLANSLASLCKACKPEVEVEALVIEGPKLATVMSQVKKLEVSVLVLGQKKPSPLINCFCVTSNSEEFAEQCINRSDCLTIGVRKQSKGMAGYLISTRWQKNFWLLA